MKKIISITIFIAALFLFNSVAFSQNPSADLDQCANGGVGQTPVICAGSAWQNGNLNANQAHYLEGQFVPYRLKFSNLVPNTPNSVTIEWDTTQNGKHALDYVGTGFQTEVSANACSGIVGCNLLSFTDFPIPLDAHVTAGPDGIPFTSDDIAEVGGNFRLFGGTVNSVSAYTLSGAFTSNSKTRIAINFTPSVANPVMFWAGHISTRQNWGFNSSAININGAPYHTRLVDLNGTGGNQDRALQAEAVIFPARLTIIKDARPDNTDQIFTFNATGLSPTNFMLDDNIDPTLSDRIVFDNVTTFGSPLTVTEAVEAGWTVNPASTCVEVAGGGTSTANSSISGRTATIIAEEGEVIVCTFINDLVTAAPANVSGQVVNQFGLPISRSTVIVTNLATGQITSAKTNAFGYFTVTGLEVGHTYAVTGFAKNAAFNTSVLSLTDNVVDYTIVGNTNF
jgi:hypothetical protein